jgi:hypothetical protein
MLNKIKINKLIVGAGFTAAITKILIRGNSEVVGSIKQQFLKRNEYIRRKSLEFNKFFSDKAESRGSLNVDFNNVILHDRLILGGNSAVWGGHVNIEKIPKTLLKFFKKKNLIFKKLSFSETGTISNNKNIYQIQNKNKKIFSTIDLIDKITSGYLHSFYIKNKKIYVNIYYSKKKKIIEVNKLYLCIGSMQFLDLLYRSKFLKDNDLIELSEYRQEYLLKFWNTPFNNKFFTVRYRFSRAIGHFLGVQYFSKLLKIFNFLPFFIDQNIYRKKIKYILQIKNGTLKEKNCNIHNYKFGKSAHYCNLKINSKNINIFLKKINKNIKGLGMSFINQTKPGPISNEIILDIKKKIK